MTKFERPLQLELRPSRRVAAGSALLHVLAAASAATTPGAPVLRVVLPVLVVAHFVYFLRRQVMARTSRSVRAITWDRQRGWRVANAAGDWRPVRLGLPIFISYRLVVVRFRVSTFKSRSAVIAADRLSGDQFRRLRVRLLQSAYNRRC